MYFDRALTVIVMSQYLVIQFCRFVLLEVDLGEIFGSLLYICFNLKSTKIRFEQK